MPSKKSKLTDELVQPVQVQSPSNPGLLPLDEPLLRKRIARKTKIKVAVVAVLIAALALYLILDVALHGPLISLLSNRDKLVASVQSFGPFAPLLYILLQITQTVVAPIPGQIVGSVGGFCLDRGEFCGLRLGVSLVVGLFSYSLVVLVARC